jgi:hypothetical protein
MKKINFDKLRQKKPDIFQCWHSNKNLHLNLKDIKSYTKIWWQCPVIKDHEWQTYIHNKKGCPYCAGQKITLSNCLSTTHPEIARE